LHHEGHEEHEVEKFENINFRILRVLRALRGETVFLVTPPLLGVLKNLRNSIAKKRNTIPNAAFLDVQLTALMTLRAFFLAEDSDTN
jgi:hypothetical protein